ncbi:MAG: YggS family pyridoxal phosphate-dependent enzyme [Sphingobacteriales bacterium]|nr:YggS family pyridoxal phosphate-dependent enzyme [Sphingobacteriales bacterium]
MANMAIFRQIKAELEEKGARLVAVSKTRTTAEIMELYAAGQRIFGENRVQEMVQKYEQLPKDIEWHLIGHLQNNKVKYIAPWVALIHSADSLQLLQTINKEAARQHRRIDCLLQFHIAQEESKYGFTFAEVEALLESEALAALQHIRISGVMAMATFTDDVAQIRREFATLQQYYRQLKQRFFSKNDDFKEISMGMSGDYNIAIEEGSTMVRIGSLLFEE